MPISSSKLYIYVQSQFEAFHRWREAPDEVAFLRNWHRHIFKVRVELAVTHGDRDLEFFLVQRDLNVVLAKWSGRRMDVSCEMFCVEIYKDLVSKYPSLTQVEVSEDGENGAILRNDGE